MISSLLNVHNTRPLCHANPVKVPRSTSQRKGPHHENIVTKVLAAEFTFLDLCLFIAKESRYMAFKLLSGFKIL